MSTEQIPAAALPSSASSTDIGAVFEAALEAHAPGLHTVHRGTERDAPVLVVPNGMRAIDARPFLEAFRRFPERPAGVSAHQTMASIIEHAKGYSTPFTAAWCTIDTTSAGVSASLFVLYDYHLPPAVLEEGRATATLEEDDSGARHCGFAASYAFPIAPEFQVWKAASGKAMTQAEMAAFLEDHLAEVCDASDPGARTADLAKLLEVSVASASSLLGFSRRSAATVNLFVSEKRDPSTGAVELIYQEEVNHQTEDRARVVPPGVFAIKVPVLQNGAEYRLPVRLKSAVSGRAVKWTFEVYRLDVAVQTAVEEELARFKAETGVRVYRGRYNASK